MNGFLKKVAGAFVEEVQDEEATQAQLAEIRARMNSIGTPSEVPETMNVDGLVTAEEVYSKFNLNNANSIFKVKDFMKTLPESLPTDIKRQTLLGVIGVSGLDLNNLLEDAGSRIGALNATMNESNVQTETIISTNEGRIAELNAEIDALKQEINDRKILQENQTKLVNEEVKAIQEIVDFVNPQK